MTEHDDSRRYAAAVRAALAELGAEERAALLDDLEADMAEVASESAVPLRERLGGRAAVDAGKGDRWTSEYLVERARAGQVRMVEIEGNSAVATDRAGVRHPVEIADNSEALAQQLTRSEVDVVYQPAGGGLFWLSVLAPNLLLLVLIGGVAALVVWALRRPARSPGAA